MGRSMDDQHDLPTATSRQRFVEDLPWYLNGTLDPQERAWVEAMLDSSAWARREHAFELEISRATRAQLDDVPEMPVADLLQRVRNAQPQLGARPVGRVRPWLEGLLSPLRSSVAFIAQPGFAMGLLAVVVLQTATLGWFALRGAEDAEATRSFGQRGTASIRLRAAQAVSEAQIRQALLAAGVTIVQGPNDLGEYIARPTGIRSMEESLAALRASNAFASIEVQQ